MSIELSRTEQDYLLRMARQALELAVRRRSRLPMEDWMPGGALREPHGCFVTLEKNGSLRGCIGTLCAERPLFEEVLCKIWSAALEDPRFSPVQDAELHEVDVEISILETPVPLAITGLEELIERLRPGRDGLVLSDGRRSATFLPSVWEKLQQPGRFVHELLRKGGWPPDHWSGSMQASIYGVHCLADRAPRK